MASLSDARIFHLTFASSTSSETLSLALMVWPCTAIALSSLPLSVTVCSRLYTPHIRVSHRCAQGLNRLYFGPG